MKKLIAPFILCACAGMAFSQMKIDSMPLGSGTPGNDGVENAVPWDLDIFHAPQYLPGYPTAATIFPRAITVSCVESEKGIHCKGYQWRPEMGRAEYLMIRPIIVKEAKRQN